jgi:hypothetical protein
LHDAGELTGIPASTIRNWARKRRIDSRFELDETGDRRYVELSEVIAWADHLGRRHTRVAARQSRVASEDVASEEIAGRRPLVASAEVEASRSEASDEDEDEDENIQAQSTEPAEEAPTRDEQPATDDPNPQPIVSQPVAPEVPEGTMLVPLDAWNKMLNQLGNLHEAGQQLADARERAAKAETEVVFLRERLAELREQKTPTPNPVDEQPTVDAAGFDPLWVDLYRRWNRRRAR